MSDDLSIPNPTYRVPRRGRRGGLDPAMQRLMIYAGGVVGVLALIGGASLLFNRHSGPVPVVQADSRPLRVKPENPGGLQISGVGDDTADDGKGKLAPAPEIPNPKGLRAAASAEAPAASPLAPPVTAAPPVATAPPPASPAASAAAPAASAQSAARVAAVPAPVKPAPAAPVAAPVASAPVAPAPTAAAPAAHAGAKPAPVGGSRTAVQLAALSSEEAAKVEWQRMEKRMPDLLGGHSPTYTKVDRDGHTFWRVRVAGFGDLGQAKAFCERVRAKGATCSVADF